MPLPKTKSVGKLMHFLHKENQSRPKDKKWTHKQMVAISLTQAQKNGAEISKKENYINSTKERFMETKEIKEFRQFITKEIEINQDINELKSHLRKDIVEMTTSGNIGIGPNVEQGGKISDVIPAGVGDQAKVEPPEDINVIDIENPQEDEDEDDELEKLETENDIKENDESDLEDSEELEDVSDDELVQVLSDMNEEEFEELVDNLSPEEKEHITGLLNSINSQDQYEAMEYTPNIEDTVSDKIGSEDDKDGMIQVGDSLEDSPSKDRTVNQIEVDPELESDEQMEEQTEETEEEEEEEEESDADNVSPSTPSITTDNDRVRGY